MTYFEYNNDRFGNLIRPETFLCVSSGENNGN